jgi:hypothetical protein
MKALATIVAMFLVAFIASAQTQASMTAAAVKVEQGKTVPFSVTVKPAANLNGQVRVLAKLDSGDFAVDGAGSLGAGQNSTTFSMLIPPNAPTGKYTVTRVTFHLDGGSHDKTLNVANLPSFEVVEHKAVEPDSAVVEVK